MRFEELISKYLDSELTFEEDKELRHIISEDPTKKVEFEEYIELSYILKKDSTFNLMNEEDQDDIEDNLLMHIMDEQSKVTKKVEFSSYSLSAVFSVILVFFVSIYTVFDTNIGDSYNKESALFRIAIPNLKLEDLSSNQEYVEVNNSDIENNNSEIVRSIPNSSISDVIKNNSLDNNDSQNINENNSSNIANVIITESNDNLIDNSSNSKSNNEDEQIKDIFNSSNLEKNIRSTNSNFANNDLNLLKMNYEQNDLKFNDLSFESIIYTDLNRTGFNPSDKKVLNSFSQSVAFKLTEKTKIGVELGKSQYEFTTLKSVTIPYRDLGGYNGSLDGAIRMPNGLLTKINTTVNYNTIFANIFYDSKLLVSEKFKINGRLGIGISNGGLLASGRLYADITIYGPLHITTGLDTRVFQNDNLYYNENGIMNSSVSFVNGIYFEF